jgi:hypothetical protein
VGQQDPPKDPKGKELRGMGVKMVEILEQGLWVRDGLGSRGLGIQIRGLNSADPSSRWDQVSRRRSP